MAMDQNQCRENLLSVACPSVIPSWKMNLSPKFFLSIVVKKLFTSCDGEQQLKAIDHDVQR